MGLHAKVGAVVNEFATHSEIVDALIMDEVADGIVKGACRKANICNQPCRPQINLGRQVQPKTIVAGELCSRLQKT